MDRLKKFLYHGCAYTILIFGFIISLAEFIFEFKSLNTALKYATHYLVLFATFFIIFLSIRTEDGTPFSTSFIFSALAIFSVGYLLILGAAKLVGFAIGKYDKKANASTITRNKYNAKRSKK